MVQTRHDHLKEWSSSGGRLVAEDGNDRGRSIGAQWVCDDWTLTAQGAYARGARAYDGLTQNGSPFATQTLASQRQWRTQLSYRAWPQLSLELAYQSHQRTRTIESGNGVQGYPEQYEFQTLQAGLTLHQQIGPVAMGLGLDQSVASRARSSVTLPNYPTAQLQFDRVSVRNRTLSARYPISETWALVLRHTESVLALPQSGSVWVGRNGGVSGVTIGQPRLTWSGREWGMSVEYLFF